jgi:hypothetical protein
MDAGSGLRLLHGAKNANGPEGRAACMRQGAWRDAYSSRSQVWLRPSSEKPM